METSEGEGSVNATVVLFHVHNAYTYGFAIDTLSYFKRLGLRTILDKSMLF